MWRKVLALLSILAGAAAPAAAADPEAGSVSLPLDEYLALRADVERRERELEVEEEKPLSALTRQATSIVVEDGIAELAAEYRVERRGRPGSPVPLPFPGLAERATIAPAGEAALHRDRGNVQLVAGPGGYDVALAGRRQLDASNGVFRLTLPASPAPVATLALDLPADFRWNCDGAVVVADEAAATRRRVELAPQPGKAHVLELSRRRTGAEEERVHARSTVVTVVELNGAALKRHDVVLYDVERGSLGTFELDLPPELEVVRAATDEGPALPLVDGGHLRVERRQRLEGAGHLAVTYRPQAADSDVALPEVPPRTPARARYLVLAAAVAADVEPRPAGSWARVDLDDLPGGLRDSLAALGPSAVWRRTGAAGETRLEVSSLPPAEALGNVVWQRETTTVLTLDGALVHRDLFTLEQAGSVLELDLPEGATLWSAEVDGLAVRPVERGRTLAVPLAFEAGGSTRVELVTVERRSIERGRSRIGFLLPEVSAPVLAHRWRLLLPEDNRYRFAASELRPVAAAATPAAVAARSSKSGAAYWLESSAGTRSRIRGRVVLADGGQVLPGVTVWAQREGGEVRETVTSGDGTFTLHDLQPGQYDVEARLEGFTSVFATVDLRSGQEARFEIGLGISAIAEQITVTAEAGVPGRGPSAGERRKAAEEALAAEQAAAARRELESLSRGLAGGIKPLAVKIPESGKLLLLSGVLPPPRVHAELEVKSRG